MMMFGDGDGGRGWVVRGRESAWTRMGRWIRVGRDRSIHLGGRTFIVGHYDTVGTRNATPITGSRSVNRLLGVHVHVG
jgi:hypothetical protein